MNLCAWEGLVCAMFHIQNKCPQKMNTVVFVWLLFVFCFLFFNCVCVCVGDFGCVLFLDPPPPKKKTIMSTKQLHRKKVGCLWVLSSNHKKGNPKNPKHTLVIIRGRFTVCAGPSETHIKASTFLGGISWFPPFSE